MPSFSDGLKTGLLSVVVSFVAAAILSAWVNSLGMPWMSVIILAVSIIGVIELFENTPYWSIGYSAGYLLSIIWFGKYFMEWWELPITVVIILFYISLKIYKKF